MMTSYSCGSDVSLFVSCMRVRPPPPASHQHYVALPMRAVTPSTATTANPNYRLPSPPILSTIFTDTRYKNHHHHLGLKVFQAGDYLDNISNGGESINNGNSTLNGQGAEQEIQQEEYEDDDYAMSIPTPVRSSEYISDKEVGSNIMFGEDINGDVTVHPNEEPPEEDDDDCVGELCNIYEDEKVVKKSKFDALGETIKSASGEKVNENKKSSKKKKDRTTKKQEENESPTSTAKKEGPIKSLIQNLMGGDNSSKEREVKERERKWSEWMRSGRKTREDGDVSLDESLLSIDKGADYVVVAVPAEAAEGLGPILPSFPGGKLFQKTVGKTFQDVVNSNADFPEVFGGNKNSTSAPRSATISLSPSDKKLKKNKKKDDVPKKKNKKRPTLSIEMNTKKKHKTDAEKRNIEQQERYIRRQQQIQRREPGRISANDWSHNIRNIFSSTILRDVRGPVAWVFVWATLWSVLHKVLTTGALASSSPKWMVTAAWLVQKMCLPTIQHTMMVSAMSFLLVFRTNSAYQRFAEGRKIWNDIVDAARDFSRMMKLYEFAIGTSKCRTIKNLLASFPYLLRHRIRPSLMSGMFSVSDANVERDPENSLLLYPDESLRDTDPEVAARAYDEEETGSSRRKTRELCWVDKRTLPWKLLPGSALELCARAQNRPLWVCDRMAKELAVVEDMAPKFTNRERLAMIGYVDKLSRSIGACERIHQTVVPLNYARHALRSLTVWLWTLPFVLVKDLGLLTGPVVAVLSWILYGVYEIGSRIEDPFQGTLRLSIYCDAIRRDVLADAIARDTAFDLDEEKKSSGGDIDGDYDALFESESEEYDGADVPAAKKKKKGDFFESLEVFKL